MELRFSSKEVERCLLDLFSSGVVVVRSIGEDGKEGRCLYVTEYVADEHKQNELPAINSGTTEMVHGALGSPDPMVSNEQDQQANIDVNKPVVKPQQLKEPNLLSEKSVSPLLSKQLSVSFYDQQLPQHHGSGSDHSNRPVSQLSEVTKSTTTQSEAQPTSSFVTAPSDPEACGEDNETMTPQSAPLVVELTSTKKHSVHCFLHRSEDKCDQCETQTMCQNNYDNEFITEFEKFLAKDPNASLPPTGNEGVQGDYFLKYIEVHIKAKKCPLPCSRLWKYCVDNKLFRLLKYAPEGLLIHSSTRQSEVGTVIDTYSGYMDVNMIGSGGFGNVYQYKDQLAVKEEFKQPLIDGNPLLFQRIMELDHPHVIKVLEYIVGPNDESNSEKKCFLSVMPFKNQMDLRKQFTKDLTCVLDYMTVHPDQKKFIFRNYIVLLRHIFKGLCYLKSQDIVHRDIKSSNILVHQECKCESPLQCMCAGDGRVTYLLGDLDLLSLEEENLNLTYTCEEWVKMAGGDPAGTIGMKPPESFFRNEKGEHVTTHKSDVWSACATVMNVLIGKAENKEAQEEIGKFITAATEGTKNAATSAARSLDLLESITNMFDQMKREQRNTGLDNSKMTQLSTKLNELMEVLTNAEKSLHRSQSFQGGFCEIYKEENPLAGILTTAYGAQVLQWKCFKKLQHVYDTQLWSVIEPTLDAIVAGIKFVPDRRQDAVGILNDLENVPPVDCSNNG